MESVRHVRCCEPLARDVIDRRWTGPESRRVVSVLISQVGAVLDRLMGTGKVC